MDYYAQITVLPDPEFSTTTLLNAIFSKLHRELVDINNQSIGVSFPQHHKTLGNCLRLHGSESDLQKLMAKPWLRGLLDYTCVTEVMAVPKETQHRIVRRVHIKTSVERLYRRSVRKGWLNEDEAQRKVLITPNVITRTPFLTLTSGSNKQRYTLFVEHGPALSSPSRGTFNNFGLSLDATVPYF